MWLWASQMKIKKIDVAVNHLRLAIELFLNGRDQLSVVTLAGAAEEILGRYAERKKNTPMIEILYSALRQDISPDSKSCDFKRNVLNGVKNTIKHFNDKEEEIIDVDPETEALAMMVRAIYNLLKYNGTVTENTHDLFDWINKNRSELFPGPIKLIIQS